MDEAQAQIKIQSDLSRCKQVISNLVNNALKFTDHGYVELGLNIDSDSIVIYVKDTGEGIGPEDLQSIFSEFVRLDLHDKQAIRGVGLGLAISKRLADLLNCKLDVHSSIGAGSEFRLRIPNSLIRKDTALSNTIDQVNHFTGECNWESKRILLAEDEESNYKYLLHPLQKTKVQIDWVTNGKEAVEKIRESGDQYSLVLMDINMPIMNGYDTLKESKRLKPELAVIAQTAYAMESDAKKCNDAGFDHYLSKPILPNVLLETLAKYLS